MDCTAQRTCTEQWIKANLAYFIQSGFSHIQTDVLLFHTFRKFTNLDAGDFANSLLIKSIEDNDFINTVNEFGSEVLLDFIHPGFLHYVRIFTLTVHDFLRTEVGSHNDDGILEVNRASLTVGHTTVVQGLKQDVEYVRMSLFNFVEKNHAVRFTAYGFR